MVTYVAFLRGINVAGQKLIKMQELARAFESAGFRNVRTFIQSGNVVFDSGSSNPVTTARKISRVLQQRLGYEVTVILRTLAELEAIVRGNPFKKIRPGAEVVLFVVFLSVEAKTRPRLPLISTAENLEVFEINEGAAFVVARRKKNGWFGFPNAFVEKELGVSATTRNFNTVRKIVDFANPAKGAAKGKKI